MALGFAPGGRLFTRDRVRPTEVFGYKPLRLSFAIVRRAESKFIGHRHRSGGILCCIAQLHVERGRQALAQRFQQTTNGGTMKSLLVSVVVDDRYFRECMRRLMRSLGYTVDIFSSAADFLASPRLPETARLNADTHMPAMTGLELYRLLIDTGQAIPTIPVTEFPMDTDCTRALNDGVVCYLRRPVHEDDLERCESAFLGQVERRQEIHDLTSALGKMN